jgi:spore coat protein H
MTRFDILRPLTLLSCCIATCSCGAEDADAGVTCAEDDQALVRPDGWTVASHCPESAPDYDRLFPDVAVHRFDITVSADDYQATMDDLTEKLSGGQVGDDVESPIFVPVTVQFDGLTWTNVAMRYKGNSSLRSAWQSGIRKLAIRFNFDLYETTVSEIVDQRFFGFQKMTFSNAFKDPSLIRDKVAGDIFRAGGVPAARAAFARIYVDHGEGPVYFGLYTMIEDPSDDMLGAQFGDNDGNLYKPEGEGAKWGDPELVEEAFDKKTNKADGNWSDAIATVEALHADRTDAAAWRAGLEELFDAPGFLRCLAINQAMENWDSYGFMTHNYYVYADPSNEGRLTWFPWDLNLAMVHQMVESVDPSSVMLDEITNEWPLIRFLLDDSEYRANYESELQAAIEGPFAIDTVHGMMDAYHALIAPYVVGDYGEASPYTFLQNDAAFEGSLTTGDDALKPHVESRHAAVIDALGL